MGDAVVRDVDIGNDGEPSTEADELDEALFFDPENAVTVGRNDRARVV